MERRRGFVNELDLKIIKPICQFVFFLFRTFDVLILFIYMFILQNEKMIRKKKSKKHSKCKIFPGKSFS